MIDTENFFLPLRAVSSLFGLKDTTGATVFTTILLMTIAIVSIAHNVLTTALCTGMNMSFGNHAH